MPPGEAWEVLKKKIKACHNLEILPASEEVTLEPGPRSLVSRERLWSRPRAVSQDLGTEPVGLE